MKTAVDRSRLVFVLVWVATALYLLPFVDRAWVPPDEGLLGQTAERILQGELPHRDFDDMYTGGQAFLHALVFLLFGVKLTSLRWLLYVAALLALPLPYLLARRVAPPWAAGVATLVCVVWTLPNYFASMPSWYNLFLTFAAMLALLRAVDGDPEKGARWYFAAGCLTGLSFLIKSSALLLLAAVLLFLVFREQELDDADDDIDKRHSFAFPLFTTLGLGLFVSVLTAFIARAPHPSELLLFVGPSVCLCGVLLGRVWRRPGGAFVHRFRRLLTMALPYFGGVALPCLLFLVPYLYGGGIGELLQGKFLFVGKRLLYTAVALPKIKTMICAVPMLLLLLWPFWRPVRASWERRLLFPAAIFATLVVAIGNVPLIYYSVWSSARPLVLVVTLTGCLLLLLKSAELTSAERQSLFLVLAVATLLSVTQFPFSLGIYFCYIAPLVILAALYVVRLQPGAPLRLHLAALIMYGVFAALWLNLSEVLSHGSFFSPSSADTPLAADDRGGLQVSALDAEAYDELVEVVRRHSKEGSYILALPDCPEIYFLSGRRNPTRFFYDYFEEDYGEPERTERLFRLIEEHDVDLVVIYWFPAFSKLPDDFPPKVAERFPHLERVPPRFTVHWREPRAD